MMLNYHEMTMNQPKNDPAKRQQMVVITTVMVSVLAYSLMTTGVFLSILPTEGVFPGGNFCYKLTTRDYAASMGLGRNLKKEILEGEGENWKEESSPASKEIEAIMYHLYFDDPTKMGGRRQRWATGIMGTKSETVDKCQILTSLNKSRKPMDDKDRKDLPAREYFELLPVETTDLPSVDALVLNFPNTHGFVSALTMSYKVIPALRQIAQSEKYGIEHPVVISNCSKEQEMCTHYVPLVKTTKFLLGQPDSMTYNSELGEEPFFLTDINGMKMGAKKILPNFLKQYIFD